MVSGRPWVSWSSRSERTTDVPELRVFNDGKMTATYPLEGDVVTIGRDSKNTIALRDKTASANHAEVSLKSEGRTRATGRCSEY